MRRARYNSSLVSRLDAAYAAAQKEVKAGKKSPELVMVVSALEYELPDVPGSKHAQKGASGSRPQAYLEALLAAAEKALPKKTSRADKRTSLEILLDFRPNTQPNLRSWLKATLDRLDVAVENGQYDDADMAIWFLFNMMVPYENMSDTLIKLSKTVKKTRQTGDTASFKKKLAAVYALVPTIRPKPHLDWGPTLEGEHGISG